MISTYLNQSITWKSKGAVNEYNEAASTTTTIKGRFEYRRKMVRSRTGQDIVSEAQCYTKAVILPDDIITFDNQDWIVHDVRNIVDLFGKISHYEVIL